jgi:hypothetical protein
MGENTVVRSQQSGNPICEALPDHNYRVTVRSVGQYTRPSALRSCPAYVLLAVAIADSISFADPDLWGHIRFGQVVLQAHGLIIRDIYSYSAAGYPWHNHELGFELLVAVVYNSCGIFGLKLLKLAFAAVTIILIAAAQAETGAGLTTQRWVLMLIALGLAPQIQFRPQLVSFALTAALMALLAHSTYRHKSHRLWFSVSIMAVWANFHGGYIIGLGILATYCTTALFASRDGESFWRCAAVGLALLSACALATLANPYGVGIWRTVGHALSNPVTRAEVTEWRPLLSRLASQLQAGSASALLYLYVLLIMGTFLAVVILTPTSVDIPLIAVAGLMIAAALYATRNMAFALLAISVPLTRHLAMLKGRGLAACLVSLRRWSSSSDTTAPQESSAFIGLQVSHARPVRKMQGSSPRESFAKPSRAGQIFVATCALALALKSGLFSPSLKAAPNPFPAGVVEFMRRNSLRGNILCNFAWGEYLIWHTAPASKVFIDGRYDTVYPDRVIRDYMRFYFALPGAERMLAAYPHDFAIIPPTVKAYTLLRRQSGWRLIYQDRCAAMFARAQAAAGLPAVDPSSMAAEPAAANFFP